MTLDNEIISWLCLRYYRFRILVADESAVELRAGDLELAVQVVGRLLVRVRHLVTKNSFKILKLFVMT